MGEEIDRQSAVCHGDNLGSWVLCPELLPWFQPQSLLFYVSAMWKHKIGLMQKITVLVEIV